jgi:hypothetical protein
MTKDHIVSSLLCKRSVVAGKIEHVHAELNGLIADLDYIDNAIRIIDPSIDATLTKTKPYPPRMGALRGEMQRFVLAHLRNATEPASSLEIIYAVMEGHSLDANDVRAAQVIRKRVGACLYKLKTKGVVQEVASEGEYRLWVMDQK